MGKPTGFIEFNRETPDKISAQERIKNFREFVAPYKEEALNRQSARCMNCGIPFCHAGCPLGNIIPEFNDAVYRKSWLEAYEILSSTNNFPEFTGRICPAPCETACVLGINQPPVSIEEIEKHIIEIAFEKGYVAPKTPRLRSGKKIAIVGSGPAGLAAAAQLNQAGHLITVFEREKAPGGLLRYGIPDFKLEKWVVERRIGLMEKEGIIFRCGVEVGKEISINDLLREYQAIVLAGGSTIARDLNIPGRALSGVHFAMEFLKQQNQLLSGETVKGTSISAKGKRVVVIGGGDTGSDCVGTSNRQGALSVTQFELLPQPPTQRTEHMPWPTYPMLLKTTSSHKEGVNRKWATATKAFIGNGEGKLSAVRVVDLRWKTMGNGSYAGFEEIEGTEREIPCDLVLLAMGFVSPQKEGLLQQLDIELDERGNVKTAEGKYQTSIPKIFSAGDMRRGQSLVVWAISEGRECARKVDEYLMGHSVLETRDGNFFSMIQS